MVNLLKKRLFEILDVASSEDRVSRMFDLALILLISLNVLAVVLETVDAVATRFSGLLNWFESVSVAIFTIEYILRIWTSTEGTSCPQPITGRIKYALTPFALIDLIAILPFYLPFMFAFDLRFVRILRMLRFFRLFKLARYSKAMRILGTSLKSKKEELVIVLSFVLILLVFASSLMYFIETQAQPEVFPNIISALWWGVATLTTVGYGDVYPVTALGKFLGSIIALLGIGIFALPAGILASGFSETLKIEQKPTTCPHCGKPVE